jgi:hypothetical protein
MLSDLHNKINAIVPIEGLLVNENGSIRVDYIDFPNPAQYVAINAILNNLEFEYAKINKLNEIEVEWKETVESGWETPLGWKLGINIQDITLLNGAFTLAKEANSLGITDPVTIVDTEGNTHSLSLADLTPLMLQYGNARAVLSSNYANRKNAIKAATTLAELELI